MRYSSLHVRILFLSSEVAPWSKTGGLGDVAGALPQALADLGHDVTVASPLYSSVSREGLAPDRLAEVTVTFPSGQFRVECRSRQTARRLKHLFLDSPELFSRSGIYGESGRDYADNAMRFACFTRAALLWAVQSAFAPQIVHANDWQTGLAMMWLRTEFSHPLPATRGVFTIHNLAYQGNFNKVHMQALGLDWKLFNVDGVEFFDHLSFMKSGLQFAHAITTVSPTYAREIQSEPHGVGFSGLLKRRQHALTGILNGIDTQMWNPATDVLLPAQFSGLDVSGKAVCRKVLISRLNLAPRAGLPLFGIISRMVAQKGTDVVQAALPAFLEAGCAAVVLGTGDKALEAGWQALAARFPSQLHVTVGFDESLAHLIEAGSDFFLMPSRFEPCGLNQLYSLRYGSVPVVHRTGGLADSVIDVSEARGTGVQLPLVTPEALRTAMNRAVELFQQPAKYREVQKRGMAVEVSWQGPAQKYSALYSSLVPSAGVTLR